MDVFFGIFVWLWDLLCFGYWVDCVLIGVGLNLQVLWGDFGGSGSCCYPQRSSDQLDLQPGAQTQRAQRTHICWKEVQRSAWKGTFEPQGTSFKKGYLEEKQHLVSSPLPLIIISLSIYLSIIDDFFLFHFCCSDIEFWCSRLWNMFCFNFDLNLLNRWLWMFEILLLQLPFTMLNCSWNAAAFLWLYLVCCRS